MRRLHTALPALPAPHPTGFLRQRPWHRPSMLRSTRRAVMVCQLLRLLRQRGWCRRRGRLSGSVDTRAASTRRAARARHLRAARPKPVAKALSAVVAGDGGVRARGGAVASAFYRQMHGPYGHRHPVPSRRGRLAPLGREPRPPQPLPQDLSPIRLSSHNWPVPPGCQKPRTSKRLLLQAFRRHRPCLSQAANRYSRLGKQRRRGPLWRHRQQSPPSLPLLMLQVLGCPPRSPGWRRLPSLQLPHFSRLTGPSRSWTSQSCRGRVLPGRSGWHQP
mmetsp:Transcript_12266/g.27227  ORF Transcript_12266/g.27227 Transcript_12266/m.27227 type:complete len:275 (-) Transcript_12266:1030-1854(-)